jgi:hypothetical protein
MEDAGQGDGYTGGPPSPKSGEGPVYAGPKERDDRGRFKPGNKISKAGGEAHRQARKNRKTEAAEASVLGSVELSGRAALDREVARQSLLDVLADRRTPAAAKVSAARSLAELEEKAVTRPLPTSSAQLEAMTNDELDNVIRQLEAKLGILSELESGPEGPEA